MHILSGKSKCIDRSSSREREREREMCVLFEFRHFLVYVFQSFVYILQKILIDEMSYIINGICADGEQAKAFWLSEGRTKV